MSLFIPDHILSNGGGSGNGLEAAFMPSTWHMLSYAKYISPQEDGDKAFKTIKSQLIIIKNACDGLSDLLAWNKYITLHKKTLNKIDTSGLT